MVRGCRVGDGEEMAVVLLVVVVVYGDRAGRSCVTV